jgi:hypothetical protein
MTTTLTTRLPLVLELDEDWWKTQLDRVESWLDNVLTLQTAFRQLAEDTAGKITEPHVRDYLAGMA